MEKIQVCLNVENSRLQIYMIARINQKRALSKPHNYMVAKRRFKTHPLNNINLLKKFSFYKKMINNNYTIQVNSISRIKNSKRHNFTLMNSHLPLSNIPVISQNTRLNKFTKVNRRPLLNTRVAFKSNLTKHLLFILKICNTLNNSRSSQDIKPLNFIKKINNQFRRSNRNSRRRLFTRILTGSHRYSKFHISSSSSKILIISKALISIRQIVNLKTILKQYNKIKWIILNLERKSQNK